MRKQLLLIAALAGQLTVSATAQAPNPAVVKDSIGASMMRLRRYQWIQTMKLSVDGELKQTSISSCKYPAGAPKAQCAEISSTPAEAPSGGPIRKKKMKQAIAEMKAYMDSVKVLLGNYVPPQQAKIEAAMQVGGVAIAPNPSTGALAMAISNYAQKGDKMNIVLGAANSQLHAVNIATWLNDPSALVTLDVAYAALNDGTHYPQQTTLNVTAKKIVISISTTNYSLAP